MIFWQLSAIDAVEAICSGRISSAAIVEACLERIAETDPEIGAWSSIDSEQVMRDAAEMDDLRLRGRPVGRLHGVPVALGAEIGAGAAVENRLREAGAVILGKTASADHGAGEGAVVRNPHDKTLSAGGISAGAAAAVSAGHAPLAIGVDVGGSIAGAASNCGVYGFTPTQGIISRNATRLRSATLDQIGVFGRSLADMALLADVLGGYDPADPSSNLRPKPQMLEGTRAKAPVGPCFAWFDLPAYGTLSEAFREGLSELKNVLGEQVEDCAVPGSFAEALASRETVLAREAGHSSDAPGDEEYRHALAMASGARTYFDAFFKDYDAIIAPAALGEAAKFEHDARRPDTVSLWNFAGLPCLSLPLLQGETGLPAGVQFIGAAEQDDRLLRTAAWLEAHLEATADEDTQISA